MARLYVLVYSFAMKYVLIFVAVIIMVRIDVILSLFDRATNKFDQRSEVIVESGPASEKELISFKEDQSIIQTPRKIFFAVLLDFVTNPTRDNRIKALSVLKNYPNLLTPKAEPELEAIIYQWRDLLLTKDIETISFLVELQTVLRGENLEMIKKFTSLLMDEDMDFFLKYYNQSNDSNCSIAILLGDNLAEQERRNEFYDRESKLNVFLSKENKDPLQKDFARTCLMVLRVELDKFAPAPALVPESQIDNSLPAE